MKISFPVQKDEGMDSAVYNHFGSTPMFVLVDTDANSVTVISNRDQHHSHGACSPMKALGDQKVDAIVVGSIGAGALNGLNRMGIRVHRCQAATIRQNIEMFKNGTLAELTLQECCNGHGRDGGCSHYITCYKKKTMPSEVEFWSNDRAH
jgi:predicted Fe-Mo cluster-binding NifX family protein